MTEKEEKTYCMVYICMNCGTKKDKEFPLGQPAPPSVDEEEICDYCGWEYFSHPRKPKMSDYTDME